LEVSTKTYALPRLPKEWDGLSIVHLADTHFLGAVSRAYFEAVCEQAIALKPDLFVFTGDLLDDPAHLNWLPETFGRLHAPFGQYFILGNHDWYLGAPEARAQFEQLGWIDLSSRCIELASPRSGPPIVLAGDETPWMGTHPDLRHVSSDRFRILLSHTPDNIHWARGQGIDLVLAGHTHGGQIRLPLLGPVYAPSRFGCCFASGVFWLDPTLLYVSRGISGREPIRYNCVPELTKLVLRTAVLEEPAAKFKAASLA
jgi:predicted MPP superfamily phosphohydrolase